MNRQINTRADLDAIEGTPEYATFIQALKGSIIKQTDIAEYPEGYGDAGYAGDPIDPIWENQEDLSTIEAFEFTKTEIEAL